MDIETVKDTLSTTPSFILNTTELTDNLAVLTQLSRQCGVKLLYSIKALPLVPILDIIKPHSAGFAVSSLFEARLAQNVLQGQGEIHVTTPGLKSDEIDELAKIASHINFNSLNQQQRFQANIQNQASVGLRVNPKLSFVKDPRFDPCRPHSKLGVDLDTLWLSDSLNQIDGLHLHTVFSALDFTPLSKTIAKLRHYLGNQLNKLTWLNLGGGYLFAEIKQQPVFIDLVRQLRNDFTLEVYIEPGKAIVGKAGYLVTSVIDLFTSDGKTIAVLDTSVNHNPEVFEYQRQPELHEHDEQGQYSVMLVGCTCLAGDIFGEYRLKNPLKIGDKLVFPHIGAYSLIKANRFNGYNLPDIYLWQQGQLNQIKHYTYQDYYQQWSR